MAFQPVTSRWFGERLVEAGVISAEELNGMSRIVIDCTAGEAVQVYVQRFGQADALARLAPMLGGMLRDGSETAEAGRARRQVATSEGSRDGGRTDYPGLPA